MIREEVRADPASTAGRNDCDATWLAYEYDALSVCFPADHYAQIVAVVRGPEQREFLGIRLIPGEPVAHTPNAMWLSIRDNYIPPATCEMDLEAVDLSAETSIAPYRVGDLEGVSCTAIASYATLFKGQLQTPGGAIEFRAYAVEPEMLDLVKRILATVRAVE